MRTSKLTIAAIMGITLTSGCATIIRGTTQSVKVDSEPQRAKITSNTGPSCTSPCTMELKRNTSHTLTANKPGYEPTSVSVSSSLDAAGTAGMMSNLLVSGPIGMGVDAASGAMFRLDPDTLTLVLKKDPTATLAQQ